MARPSRDPRQLAREVETAIRLREIRENTNLREALAPRFVDYILLLGLFPFALGLILTLIFALPQDDEPTYHFWLLWAGGYIIWSLVCFEFLIRKFRVVRRVVELQQRRLERLEKNLGRGSGEALPAKESESRQGD